MLNAMCAFNARVTSIQDTIVLVCCRKSMPFGQKRREENTRVQERRASDPSTVGHFDRLDTLVGSALTRPLFGIARQQ